MTDYYVSTSGDNSNDGLSVGNAFRDIEYACNHASLSAGDTIRVKTGTFYEDVVISLRSGAAGNPITLIAEDGAGTVTISGLQNSGGTDPYYPRGNFAPGSTDAVSGGTGLGHVWGAMVEFKNVSHWVIDGFDITQSRGRACLMTNASHILWKNIDVDDIRYNGWHALNSSDVSIEDSTITDCANFAAFDRSSSDIDWPVIVNMINCQNVRVQRCDVSRSWGEGIATGRDSVDIEILDNRIKDNYALQAYLHYSQNLRFERNILCNTATDAFNRGGSPSDCLVVNMETQFGSSTPSDNFIIRNNLIVTRDKGVSFWNSGGTAGYIELNGNTIVAASGAFALHSFSNGSNYSDTKIYNNIFFAVDDDAFDGSTITQNFTWDSNYWSEAPDAQMQSGGDVTGTLNLVNAITSIGENDWPDPLNYRIQASSPANGAGTDSLYPPDDYFGTERTTPIDIGFNQYAGATGSPPVLTDPGPQSATVGTAVSLQIDATDPDLDTLTYSASNLPAGLSINSGSGLITGTPTSQGSFNSTITVGDGTYTVNRSVVWTVVATAKTITPSFTQSSTGLVAFFTNTTTSSGIGSVSYLWDFGDGNTSTDTNPAHTYAAAGQYSVKLTATEVLAVTNKVLNGDFESGTTEWHDFDATNNAQLITGASGSGNAYEIESDGAGNTQIYQNDISVTSGDILTLKIKNRGNTTLGRLKLIKDDSPFTDLGLDEFIDFTSNWTERQYTFEVLATESDARLQFAYFGSDSGTTLAVDDVELVVASDAPVVESTTRTATVGITAVEPTFSLDVSSGAPPLAVTATDTSTVNLEVDILSISVDWGDATSDSISDLGGTAEKTYAVEGDYDVVLTVETSE